MRPGVAKFADIIKIAITLFNAKPDKIQNNHHLYI